MNSEAVPFHQIVWDTEHLFPASVAYRGETQLLLVPVFPVASMEKPAPLLSSTSFENFSDEIQAEAFALIIIVNVDIHENVGVAVANNTSHANHAILLKIVSLEEAKDEVGGVNLSGDGT